MKPRKVYCFFEQSGTFKNEFKKLGYPAEDYDILNDYGQTDHVCDLFAEIRGGYEGKPSIFDEITSDDLIMAFFPCTRFENQIILWFNGQAKQQKKDSMLVKLEKDMELHKELSENYELITKLMILGLKRNLKIVFENPYSEMHYLNRYWALKPAIIDKDRRNNGDIFKKPTQYWFLGFKPTFNIIFEPLEEVESLTVTGDLWGTNSEDKNLRSKIHPQYASRFIRQYILDEE